MKREAEERVESIQELTRRLLRRAIDSPELREARERSATVLSRSSGVLPRSWRVVGHVPSRGADR